MSGGFSSSDDEDLIQAELDVRARVGDLGIDYESLGAVSNIFRVANRARAHLERSALAPHDLSFTAFTVLWVLWIWGEREARHLAAEAGISKGTLTGVMTTLERGGLATRRTHPVDRRLVLMQITDDGERTMEKVFPLVNSEETRLTSGMSSKEKQALASSLRSMLRALENLE